MVITFLEFFGICVFQYNIGELVLVWFMEKMILVPTVLYVAILLRKLDESSKELANGNLNYKINTDKMYGDFKECATRMNSIATVLSKAVDEKMKSERMKTELITNVSHDIKTPVTSIINYSSLIANEHTDNKNIMEYSGVLIRQSEKLKRLIDDLVEASKASTGNLQVNPIPCDAKVFISQISGEFEEKINMSGLRIITDVPKDEVRIMADSTRMWRVFDNLMNNICKYSQPQTRVYLSLKKSDNQAVFIIKNTSSEQLNISADELMERFVRGDSSRNTEGNGLGLSIAKNLVELQGGYFSIEIDGDLFKVIITMPLIEE